MRIKKKIKRKKNSEDENSNFEKKIQKTTDLHVENIDKFYLIRKRYCRYEQTQPRCLHYGW